MPSAPPSASDPTSPMKISAGIRVVPKESKARADERAAEDRQLGGLRKVHEQQIVGQDAWPVT